MKKRLVCIFLTSTMLWGSTAVYGQNSPSLPEVVVSDGEESVSAQALEVPETTAPEEEVSASARTEVAVTDDEVKDEETSSGAISAYAVDTNFLELDQIDDKGVHYTLTVKTNYEFNGELCCQVTNISKDVVCDVVVPDYVTVGTGDTAVSLPVRSIGENAFESAKISSVTLPETIREIKQRAFLNCTNVTDINVNCKLIATRSVQQVDGEGNPVVDENGSPVYVDELIQENLTEAGNTVNTTIENEAFRGCTALENVSISGMRTMGDSLFSGCSSLKNVTFSTDGMYEVLNNSVRATEITMRIGKLAFENCTSLEEITLGKNITAITGSQFFKGCTSLKRVSVGPTLTTSYGGLCLESFEGCTAMEKVDVDAANTYYTSIDSILYYGRADYPTQLEYCPPCNNVESIDLPLTVSQINDKSLMGNKYIKRLSAKSEVREDGTVNVRSLNILASAFEGCSALESVELEVRASISPNAFKDCTALTSMTHTIGGGSIGESAFSGCTALKNLELYCWSRIEQKAFAFCTGLETLVMGEGVGNIGDTCFEGCTSLRTADLTMAGTNVEGFSASTRYNFGTYIFKDCSSLETVDLPTGLLGISTGTFQNCVKLTTVNCGENLGIIRNLAFDNCPSLVSPPSPRFLVRIQKDAFKGCTALRDYSITRSAIILEDGAFVDCPGLVILAPDGSRAVEYAQNNGIGYQLVGDDIRDEEFLIRGSDGSISGYRGGFESLTIPDDFFAEGDIRSLGDGSVAWISNPLAGPECSMQNYIKSIDLGPVEILPTSTLAATTLETITMPDMRIIYNSALQNNRYLGGVTIPKSVEAIGSNAFSGCNFLSEVIFEEGDEADGTIAFKQPVWGQDVADYKNDSTSIFAGCLALENLVLSDRVTYIPEYCFQNCTSLRVFDSSRAVTEIRKYAFSGCTSLDTLRLSPLTERIMERAFQNCTALTDVTLQHNTFLEKEAFYGCTAIERIIIPQTVNVAISNVPFINTYEATIVCVANSKGEEYAKAFNDPVAYSHLFNSVSEAEGYAGKYNYTIEYGEFVEGVEYVTVRGKVTIPEGVVVKKDGIALTDGSYVLGGDKLTFEVTQVPGLDAVLYVNGDYFDYTKEYTVPENRNVVITLEHTELKGELTIPAGVRVFRDGEELFNGDHAMAGDELTFTVEEINGQAGQLYINDVAVNAAGTYTVPADVDLVITVRYPDLKGQVTVPEGVTVYKNGELLISGSYAAEGDQLTFVLDPEYAEGRLYINGVQFDPSGIYTVPADTDIVITVFAEAFIFGDADANSNITASDCAQVLQKSLDNSYITPVEEQGADAFVVLDVNVDGRLTADDATLIMQKSLDNSFTMPCEE